MRRGQEFEALINAYIVRLEPLVFHAHKNHALRTMNGTPLTGEPFDYEFFLQDGVHVFDAKECSTKTLRWSIASFRGENQYGQRLRRQLDALTRCSYSLGVQAYFLVWFKQSPKPNHFVCFHPATIQHALRQGSNSLKAKDGYPWEIPAIIAAEERA